MAYRSNSVSKIRQQTTPSPIHTDRTPTRLNQILEPLKLKQVDTVQLPIKLGPNDRRIKRKPPQDRIDQEKYRSILFQLLSQQEIVVNINQKLQDDLNAITIVNDKLTDLIKQIPEKRQQSPSRSLLFNAISNENSMLKQKLTLMQQTVDQHMKDKQQLSKEVLNINEEKNLSVICIQRKLNSYMKQFIKQTSPSQQQSVHNTFNPVNSRLKYNQGLRSLLEKCNQYSDMNNGLKQILEEVRWLIKSDYTFYLQCNPQMTVFKSPIQSQQHSIPAKNSIISVCFIEKRTIIAQKGELQFDERVSSSLNIKMESFMATPIYNDQQKPLGVLLAISKTPQKTPFYNSDVINVFQLYINKSLFNEKQQETSTTITSILQSCEVIATQSSLQDYSEVLQKFLVDISHTHRANVLLCDIVDKKLVRKNQNTSIVFSLQRGLAGSAATTKQIIICNNVQQDRRFVQEIDDPQGTHCTSILTVPLRDRNDQANELPRAIIQVIDRKDEKLFTESDAKLLQELGYVLIRVFESVRIQENFYNLQNVLKNIQTGFSSLIRTLDRGDDSTTEVKRRFTQIRRLFSSTMPS